jgi:hypothetical protein
VGGDFFCAVDFFFISIHFAVAVAMERPRSSALDPTPSRFKHFNIRAGGTSTGETRLGLIK